MLEIKNCKKGDVVCYPSPEISVPICFCIGIFDHWATRSDDYPDFSCSIVVREDYNGNEIVHKKRVATTGWNKGTFFRPSNQSMAKKLLCSILVKNYKKGNFNVKEAVLKLQDFDKNWQKKS